MQNKYIKNCNKLLYKCLCLKKNESLLIITDNTTQDIGEIIFNIAKKDYVNVKLIKSKIFKYHGEEPSKNIAEKMKNSDSIVCLTKMSLAHTKARFAATNNGSKFLSLPYYSKYLLENNAFDVNFDEIRKKGIKIKKKLDKAKSVKILSKKGTNLIFKIDNRTANLASGICNNSELLSSPPDSEVNIAPLENSAEGILIIDGSITCDEFGLLKKDLSINFHNGDIVSISGFNSNSLVNILDSKQNVLSRKIAEFGIGLNPKAKLCGNMLIDEGALGTIHIGIGSNSTIGGKNNTSFHLDLVIRKPTVHLDNNLLIKEGIFI